KVVVARIEVERRLGVARKCHDLLDPLREPRVVAQAHCPASAAAIAARTVGSSSSRKGTSGRRSTFWILSIACKAALTGIGFDSQNATDIQDDSAPCNARAAVQSPAAADSTSCTMRRGVALEVTEITPSPPA